jgi:hypothetical protein
VIFAIVAILAIAGAVIGFLNWRETQSAGSDERAASGSLSHPRKKRDKVDSAHATNAALASSRPTAPASPLPAAPTTPKSLADFKSGGIALEKAPGSSLVYAIGWVTNSSAHQRYGVTVEVALSDAGGKPAGVAKDYRPTLEPGEIWRFRAMIFDSRAKTGAVSQITEEQ